MGRVDKGIDCSVVGCGNQAERSMSGTKASMAPDLGLGGSKRVIDDKSLYIGRESSTRSLRDTLGEEIILGLC